MVLLNILFQRFLPTTDVSIDVLAIFIQIDFLVTNQIKGAPDPDYRNGDLHFVDHLLDLQINFVGPSWNEWDWRCGKQLLSQLQGFNIGDTSLPDLSFDEMLVSNWILLHINHKVPPSVGFLILQDFHLGAKVLFSFIVDLQEPLSFCLFSLALLGFSNLDESQLLRLLSLFSFLLHPNLMKSLSFNILLLLQKCISSRQKLLTLLLPDHFQSVPRAEALLLFSSLFLRDLLFDVLLPIVEIRCVPILLR